MNALHKAAVSLLAGLLMISCKLKTQNASTREDQITERSYEGKFATSPGLTSLPSEIALAKNVCPDVERKRQLNQELSAELQKCLDENPGRIVALEPGIYRISKKIDVKSNRGLSTNAPDTGRCAEDAGHNCAEIAAMQDLVPGLLDVKAPSGTFEMIANSATYQKAAAAQPTTFILPDANTVFLSRFFVFSNASPVTAVVKYHDGREAMRIDPRTSRKMTLMGQSGTAGRWLLGPASQEIFSQVTAYGAITVSGNNAVISRIVLNGDRKNSDDVRLHCPWPQPGKVEQGDMGMALQVLGDDVLIQKSVVKDNPCGISIGVSIGRRNVTIHDNAVLRSGDHWRDQPRWIGDGITVGDGQNIKITNNKAQGTDYALVMGGCRDCEIANNLITYTGLHYFGGYGGIAVHAFDKTTSGEYSGTRITGNTIDGGPGRTLGVGLFVGSSVWFRDANPARNVSISGNIIKRTQAGYYIDRDTLNIDVGDNDAGADVGNVYCEVIPSAAAPNGALYMYPFQAHPSAGVRFTGARVGGNAYVRQAMPQIIAQKFRCWRPGFASPGMSDQDGNAVINALYRLVLNRDADPSGIQTFKPGLVYGRSKQQDIEAALLKSGEYCARRVTLAYQEFLRRNPEAGATAAQCAAFLKGAASIDAIVNNISASPEAWVHRAFDRCSAGVPTGAQIQYWSAYFQNVKDGEKLSAAVCGATPPGAIPELPPARNAIAAGTSLKAGERMDAAGRCGFSALMQADGNFVIYRNGSAWWSTASAGNPGAFAVFQNDGNFVVYRRNNTVAFSARAAGRGGSSLALQDDGRLVILGSAGNMVWSSGKGSPECLTVRGASADAIPE